MSHNKKSPSGNAVSKQEKIRNAQRTSMTDPQEQNQEHNSRKESLGPNTKR